MKTQLNQILTVTAFFSMAIGMTLVVSWGVSDILLEDKPCEIKPMNTLIINEVKQRLDLNKSLQLLIPKLR